VVARGTRSWLVLVVCALAPALAPPGQASEPLVAAGEPQLVNL